MRLLFLLILGLLLFSTVGCSRKATYPDSIGTESDAELKQRYGCTDVLAIQQEDMSYKALVFKLPKASESDLDYRVLFYKKVKDTYQRHGAESNLVNFERPTVIASSDPRIETTEKHPRSL